MKRHPQPAGKSRGNRHFLLSRVATVLLLQAITWLSLVDPTCSIASPAMKDDVARSAVYLLNRSLEVTRSGRHNRLISALRHLRDPKLQPLFIEMANSDQPVLKIHGLLGLAEVSNMQKLDLKRVAMIDDPAVQAQLLTAAMDSDLLNNDDAVQLLEWPDLDEGVKVLIATRLVEAGRFTDLKLLHRVLDDPKLGRQGLAALLLHQLGDTTGLKKLRAIDISDDPTRDEVRQMIIETALRHDFNSIGLWTANISRLPDVEEELGMIAMRAAMRFGQRDIQLQWRQRFISAGQMTEQTRLAIIALQLAPYIEPELFDVLNDHDDQLIRRIGHTGRAIAAGDDDIADHIDALIAMHHPLMNSWALSYCREHARPDHARLIYLTLILAYEKGPEVGRIKRLDVAVDAAQELYELDPIHAAGLLKTILVDENTEPDLRKGILLALLRSHAAGTQTVVEDMLPFNDNISNNLALLLLARNETTSLTDSQFKDLGIIVQGGGGLQDTLRIQAAWSYLKRTKQWQSAIERVIEGHE